MLYGYAINVMGKSIEKTDCGYGLSNLSDAKNRKKKREMIQTILNERKVVHG